MNQFLKQITMTVAAVAALSMTAMAAEGTVTADGSLRVREESNTSANVLGSLAASATVEVTAVTENGWYQVEYNGHQGYASGDYITVSAEDVASLPVLKDVQYGVINAGPLNVRTGPSTEDTVVKIFTVGTVITIVDDSVEGWYETEDGFLSSQYIDIVSPEEAATLRATTTTSSSTTSVVDYAMQFLGCRYVYGGTSTSGFDCSGFTQYVYKNFGISLNRSSSAQYSNGVSVSRSNLQAGDLLFFSSSGGGITHVGLYIGNNQMIHASTPSTGVIISDLSGYYSNTYVGARRVL